jgi:hypothetical protein
VKIIEIGYFFNYGHPTGRKWETRQVTEDRLATIQKYAAEGQYYEGLQIIKDHGEQDTTWLETWEKIGLLNPWIKAALDPAFDKSMLAECKTLDYLIQMFEHGNFCVGQGFYYKDLCFINCVDGGDEWRTIRRDKPFETISCGRLIRKRGTEYFKRLVNTYLAASDEELESLEFFQKNIDNPKVETIRLSLKELQSMSDKAISEAYGVLKHEEGLKKVYLKPVIPNSDVDHIIFQGVVTMFDSNQGEQVIDQYILQA